MEVKRPSCLKQKKGMFSFEGSRHAEDDTECGEECGHIICVNAEPFLSLSSLSVTTTSRSCGGIETAGLLTKASVFKILSSW